MVFKKDWVPSAPETEREEVFTGNTHWPYKSQRRLFKTHNFWKFKITLAAAKSLQSCPTLCDPIDGSPPGSPVPGILQARTLEWVAISFSNAWKWKMKVKSLSCVRLFATPWIAAYQAPLHMGFSWQEYWSRVPLRWVQLCGSLSILWHCLSLGFEMKTVLFQSCGHCCFPNLLACWVQHFHSSIFQDLK